MPRHHAVPRTADEGFPDMANMVRVAAGRIFQDVPDGIDDTWTHGVLVGGMASLPDDEYLALSYAEAGTELVKLATSGGEAWRLSYPIFYSYRHALELYLKAILRPARRDHQIGPLLDELDTRLVQHMGQGIPTELLDDLRIFADIDPDSQGFRFSHRIGKAGQVPHRLTGEYWVELEDLQAFMDRVFRLLHRALHGNIP